MIIEGNKTLIEILLNNLILNAIHHNLQNGIIVISLKETILCVSNTGKVALNSEKLFKRFVVSSSKTTNSGLGLAMIKEICTRYQWQIHYDFKNDLHSFAVTIH